MPLLMFSFYTGATFGSRCLTIAIWQRVTFAGFSRLTSLTLFRNSDLDPGLGCLFLLSEGLYRFYLDGALAPELWGTFERATADITAYPGVQAWWSTRKHWHTNEFRALVERMISEGGEAKAYQRYSEPPRHA